MSSGCRDARPHPGNRRLHGRRRRHRGGQHPPACLCPAPWRGDTGDTRTPSPPWVGASVATPGGDEGARRGFRAALRTPEAGGRARRSPAAAAAHPGGGLLPRTPHPPAPRRGAGREAAPRTPGTGATRRGHRARREAFGRAGCPGQGAPRAMLHGAAGSARRGVRANTHVEGHPSAALSAFSSFFPPLLFFFFTFSAPPPPSAPCRTAGATSNARASAANTAPGSAGPSPSPAGGCGEERQGPPPGAEPPSPAGGDGSRCRSLTPRPRRFARTGRGGEARVAGARRL